MQSISLSSCMLGQAHDLFITFFSHTTEPLEALSLFVSPPPQSLMNMSGDLCFCRSVRHARPHAQPIRCRTKCEYGTSSFSSTRNGASAKSVSSPAFTIIEDFSYWRSRAGDATILYTAGNLGQFLRANHISTMPSSGDAFDEHFAINIHLCCPSAITTKTRGH